MGAAGARLGSSLRPSLDPTFRSLRIPNYRRYAGGQLVSNIGTWMQRIGQDWLVVQLTAASSVALGTTVALQFLPMLLFGLWGGVLADRLPKRPILIVTRTAMGLVALTLGLLALTGLARLWHVYALAFALGVVTALDNPTRQSFVTEVVGHRHLPNAVGLNSATFNLARVVGPAVAGLLIGFSDVGPVLLLSALTYVGMVFALLRMRPEQLHPSEISERGRGALRAGLRYVRERPQLLLPLTIVGFVGTFGFNFQMMLAPMAKEVFESGAGTFGLLSTAIAGGSLAGSLFAARRTRPRQRVLVVAAIAFGLLEMCCALMPTAWALMLLLVPAGMAALTTSTSANAYLQLGTAAAMRGRVMALYVLVFLGGKPIGTPLLGLIGDTLGPRAIFIAAGGTCLVATAVAAAVYARSQQMVVRMRVRPRPGVEVRRPAPAMTRP